jgi:hypothetical protein
LAPPAQLGGHRSGANPLEHLVSTIVVIGESRTALWLTVACAIAIHWIAPHLPMVDLPQHAAQIALWRDLLRGASPWADLFHINLVTPYLIGYGLALPLSLVVSPATAITIVLSAAMLAFVHQGICLRREFGADARLDWLMVPPFLGFAWVWGFYTFLAAAPLVLLFVRVARSHATTASTGRAVGLVLLGIVLLFSHGLAFLFACAVGGALVLAEARSLRHLAATIVPFLMLGAILLVFMLVSQSVHDAAGADRIVYLHNPIQRVVNTLLYAQGYGIGWLFLPLTAVMMLAVRELNLVFRWRAAVPLAVLTIIVLLVPHHAMKTDFLYERFALFLLPFFALAFSRPHPKDEPGRGHLWAGLVMLVVTCWISLGLDAARAIAFARESADFGRVLAAAEPRKRALSIILDAASPAASHPNLYVHHAAWYQADKSGLVDFNFAVYHPQVVRYRADRAPPIHPGFEWQRPPFDWHRHNGRDYDYYFVRHGARKPPPALLANPDCRIETVANSGAWTLYRRGRCAS